MAAAAGPSSSFACSSICPSSASFHKNVKLESCRYSHGQKKYGMLLLNDVEVYVGKSGQIVQRSSKSKKGLLVRQPTFSATSEGQPSFTELDLDTSELEVLQFVSDDDSLRSSLSHLTERTEGKPGFISFCGIPYQRRDKTFISCPSKETSKIFWLIGPSVVVAFLVFPSLYLRKILSTIFEDSLLTDFLILFFTEALFYGGVAIFVLLVDLVWRPVYRLHQLNRAAQLVTALSFSMREAETTSHTLAISNSLGTLLIVLQILGVICIWSLSSFLMSFLPSSQARPES